MNELRILQKYFSTGSAAQEKAFLSDVFVINDNFQEIILPEENTIRLLVGSKGSGKSALLEYLKQKCENEGIPVLSLTPVDIELDDVNTDVASSVLIQKIYRALVKEIAVKIGSGLGGAISNGQKAMVEAAVDSGARQQTLTDSLLRVLMPIGKAVTQIDFEKMLPKYNTSTKTLVTAINHTLPPDGRIFYILFDDIDLFGNAGSPKYIDTIWCAILAFKILAERLPNIRAIVTLRNEIWRRIRDGRNNFRDQVDHVRSMICYLLPTTEDMKRILTRRLAYCRDLLSESTSKNCFSPFFEGPDCKIPSSNERRLWEDYLVTASRDRPRDTVQLVQQLVTHAIHSEHALINDDDVEKTALQYSTERVDDLVNENSDLCPQLETVIRAFASIDFRSSVERIREFLLGIPGRGLITISGKAIQSGNMDDMFRLWSILYEIEFLTPRAKDYTQRKGYSHVRPSSDSTLVSAQRWNEMQKYDWEVHPCYRSFLINIQNQNKRMKTVR